MTIAMLGGLAEKVDLNALYIPETDLTNLSWPTCSSDAVGLDPQTVRLFYTAARFTRL